MTARLFALGAALVVMLAASGRAALPQTLEELKQRHAETGNTPEGALKLWFDACFVYMDEDTRGAGREMLQFLSLPLQADPQWDESPGNRLFASRLRDPQHQHIFRSYAKGTSPENGYRMDPNDWELNVERTYQRPGDERGLQVYLRSSGADSARPVYMKVNAASGLWYVNVYLNVYTGIRPPQKPEE